MLDYWKYLSDALIHSYVKLLQEKNFKYNDYHLGFPIFKFESAEQRRRFKESEALLEMIKKDTNTFPKECRSYIKVALKKL